MSPTRFLAALEITSSMPLHNSGKFESYFSHIIRHAVHIVTGAASATYGDKLDDDGIGVVVTADVGWAGVGRYVRDLGVNANIDLGVDDGDLGAGLGFDGSDGFGGGSGGCRLCCCFKMFVA